MIIVYILLILFFSFLLIKSVDILIVNFKALAQRTGFDQFAITELILGLTTSLPECFIGITAAFKGVPSLSLGNILGANIANLSLVIGGAAVVGGTLFVRGNFLTKDAFYAFLAGSAPLLLLLDRSLSRIDGIILIFLYVFYQANVFRERGKSKEIEESSVYRLFRRLNHRSGRREIGWIFLGIALLLFSADMLVRFSLKVATILGAPILLIGLVLISLGTTLPELVFNIAAVRRHQASMAFGNLLGSIVVNATLILGLVSLISPIAIIAFDEYLSATLIFILMFFVFYLLMRSKRRLERWEGGALIFLYLVFVLIEFIGAKISGI